ncbi:MAG: hypothetical protein M1831_004295 [Alyxoria varia]|nr:MAG: hypothetical protein M1831_004295 [Alyxoria varia]
MLPPHSIITLIALALPAALGLPSQSHPETNVLPRQQARHDPIDPTSVLNKNRVGKTLNAYTPDCYEDNDPSYAQGKSKADTDKLLQNHPTGQVIDCKTTESCDEVSITMNQSCVTNTNTWDNSVNLGISPTWEVLKDELSIGGNLAYQHNWGGQQSDQYW